MALKDLPLLMTLDEAGQFLRLSPLAIRQAAASGELPLVDVDGDVFVDTHGLLQELGVVMTTSAVA